MSEVSNSDLLDVLVEIKGEVGGLKAGHQNLQSAMAGNATATSVLAARVQTLELVRARQAGALAVIGALAGVLGALLSWLFHTKGT